MMRNSLGFIYLLLFPLVVYSQTSPYSYEFSSPKLYKTTASTPLSNSITDILVVKDTIWLGTSRGLSRSTDKGETWKNYYNTPDFGAEGITAVGYYDGMIWAVTVHTKEQFGEDVEVGSGFRYSTDNGGTWTKVPQPLDSPGDSLLTYGINKLRALPITVPEKNVTFDIAFTPNTVWIVSWTGGLRKSTDRGLTWERVVLPPDYLSQIHPNDTLSFTVSPVSGNLGYENNLNHRAFSVIAIDDSTLYVGTAGGINKSTDSGISWKKYNHSNQDKPVSGNFITALGYDRLHKSVWSASWKAEGATEYYAVSSSSDGGETWRTFLPGEKVHNFGFKYYKNDFGFRLTNVMAATDNGLFSSTNSGATWMTPGSIVDAVTLISILKNKFYSAAADSMGNSSIIWLGSGGEGLARLKETNGFWEGEWKIFLASQELKSSNESYAFPNPFTPDGGYTRIKYINSAGKSITVRIFDFGMNLVRTLIQNAPRSTGDQFEIWDGKDQLGNTVPNGVYFYRIDISSEAPIFNKIIVLR